MPTRQGQSGNKNYGTDPTHTQIAKDPPEHHFNPLAGELAKYTIKAVAQHSQ